MIYHVLFVPVPVYGSTITASGLKPSFRMRSVRMVPVWRLA